MKTAPWLLTLLFAGSTAWAQPYCGGPQAETLASVVRIWLDDGGRGSGVVVGPGRILTAAHVVDGDADTYVGFNGLYRRARVLLLSPADDLAMLGADTDNLEPVALRHGEPRPGEPVWAVGYPFAGALTTTTGRFDHEEDGDLHATAPIDSGHSGGGLFTCQRGEPVLTGMLRGYGAVIRGDALVKLANYSISVGPGDIRTFLDIGRLLLADLESESGAVP